MVKKEDIVLEGVVDKVLGGGMYSVVLDGGMKVQVKLKGKLLKSKIKILIGDKVKVKLNEVDPTKGYIIYRL